MKPALGREMAKFTAGAHDASPFGIYFERRDSPAAMATIHSLGRCGRELGGFQMAERQSLPLSAVRHALVEWRALRLAARGKI